MKCSEQSRKRSTYAFLVERRGQRKKTVRMAFLFFGPDMRVPHDIVRWSLRNLDLSAVFQCHKSGSMSIFDVATF